MDLMKNEILPESITASYNYVQVRNKVVEIFSLFEYLKLINAELELPSITASYEVAYSQKLPYVTNSKVENFVMKKIMLEVREEEDKHKKLLTKISLALKGLTKIELLVFNLSILEKKEDYDISESINSCTDVLTSINKSAYFSFLILFS